jgi:hypothetical protein
MKRFAVVLTILATAQFAHGQATLMTPCSFPGQLFATREGRVVRLPSEEMKKRATHRVDLDSGPLQQVDFRSTMVVEVLVGVSGEVVCVKSISGIAFARKPIEKALSSWTFRPEKSFDGKAVAYLGILEFALCNTGCDDKPFGMTLLR